MLKIGYIGMSHLGLNMSVGTALKGFKVYCYDSNKKIINNLNECKLHINEPNLKESIIKKKKQIVFTNKIDELNNCELVFISIDIDTDKNGISDYTLLNNFLNLANKKLNVKIPLILMSQVFPEFSKKINFKREYYYQVETLIFGKALERVTNPERIIIGSKNQKISKIYLNFLKRFTKNIIIMNYQSAELCKIAINCFLMSTLTTTNILAEICEKVDADWIKISESLKLDKRIGKFAYLNPGLGISGGNLERDLTTISDLSARVGAFNTIFSNWKKNSSYRKNWVFEKLHQKILINNKKPLITIWGLAYKDNTHSIKNSPSLELISKIIKHKIVIYDPIIKTIKINGKTFYSKKKIQDSLINTDVLCIMNSSNIFKEIDYGLLTQIKSKLILDPLNVINNKKVSPDITIISMGKQ